ncbi:toll-interacting protein-like [Bacillus rossius redtenbacheri]|uniref:toll-interacting protein-like n=1 Tax=Bacillus rossius redtenbacheri TaxID=93214 RepID=UPI002FDE3A39
MATVSSAEKNAERRKRVFVGDLPPDFLRIAAASQQQQEAADQQAALALQQQMAGVAAYAHSTAGRLSITVAQAKLAKNYGMTRMDPYARLRVGHCVYETHTDPNGGKNPRWNKVIQCLLPQGVTSIYIEIYDECSFTMDELIAWAHIPIPQAVLSGETHDDWYPLTGKIGEGQEGMINLVLSYSNTPMVLQNATAAPYMYPSVAPVMMVPTPLYGMRPQYAPVTVQYGGVPPQQQQQQQQPVQPVFAEQELKQIEEMFPNMDKEVVKSVYEANRGNKDATINSLLQMSE